MRDAAARPGRIGMWTGVLDFMSSSAATDVVRTIESLGYGTVWIPETVGRDPFVMAERFLAGTSTLQVATGIANIYARDAVTMANTARTLDEAHPGRFVLGIGVSHAHVVDKLRHHEYAKPYSTMVAYLDEMDGSIFNAVGPADRPTTFLAALGPKMLRLAGERTDGALTYFVPVEHTVAAREALGPDGFLATELMAVLVGGEVDAEEAGRRARKAMAPYLKAPNYANNLLRSGFTDDDLADGGSDRLVEALVVCGDEAAIEAGARKHLDAGADHLCVQLIGADYKTAPVEAFRALAPALTEVG
jgi:probable F420-dependent oxidoreductase